MTDASGVLGLLVLFYLFLVFKPFLLSGAFWKDGLCNAYDLQPDATIVKCKPIEVGIWGGKHFELVVKFSDKSVYRTDIGNNVQVRHNKWRYSYTERDVEIAIRKAINAHDEAVLKTR